MKRRRKKRMGKVRAKRSTAKGREIIASLSEAFDVASKGIPIETRFTVRTVKTPKSCHRVFQ